MKRGCGKTTKRIPDLGEPRKSDKGIGEHGGSILGTVRQVERVVEVRATPRCKKMKTIYSVGAEKKEWEKEIKP